MEGTSVSQFMCDLHICGSCQKKFSDLNDFVKHKKQGCKPCSLLIESTSCPTVFRDGKNITETAEDKFLQTSIEVAENCAEMPAGIQLQPPGSSVLMLSTSSVNPDKIVVPCSESLDSQVSSQVQLGQRIHVLGNISIQDLQLLILPTKQQPQLQSQLVQNNEQPPQASVQQHIQQVVDVVETEVSKNDPISCPNTTTPLLQLIDISKPLQDENLSAQAIQSFLQPGFINTEMDQNVKDTSVQSVLTAVQSVSEPHTDSHNETSGSADVTEPIGTVEIQIADTSQVMESSGFDEHHATTCTPAKTEDSQNDKSSPRLRYCCKYKGCKYVTQYSKNVERHMLIHTGEKPFVCTQCNSKFSRSDKLKNHQRIHTGDKPFKCNQCDYRCGDNSSLKKHKRIHTDERPFKCQICSYASRNSSQLTVHLRTHTGDKPFMCPECCATFKIKSDLKRHRRMHTGEKPYACTLCDFRTAVNSNLKAHMKTYHCEENMMHCKKCDFRTSSKRDFKTHMKLHTPAEQRLSCRQCSYTCTNVRLMQTHARTHSTERPFGCTLCPYNTKTRTCLNSHMRNQHPKEYLAKSGRRQKQADVELSKLQRRLPMIARCLEKFKCDRCAAGFVRADSLRSHLRSHQEKEAFDSEKKQMSEKSAVDRLMTSSTCSTMTSTQTTGEEPLSYLAANAYSINQEHEYAAIVQQEAYGGSAGKSGGPPTDAGVRSIGKDATQPCQDLHSLLPFIQNNHNTAVWENMQNLAALNHSQDHSLQDEHDQGSQNPGQASSQVRQHDDQGRGEAPERDGELVPVQTGHDVHQEPVQGTSSGSACTDYEQQILDQINVSHTVQISSVHTEHKAAQGHHEADQGQGHDFEQLIPGMVGLGGAGALHALAPYTQNAPTHPANIAVDNSQTALLVADESQDNQLMAAESKVAGLVTSDGLGPGAGSETRLDCVITHVIQDSAEFSQTERCGAAVPVNEATESSHIKLLPAIKDAPEVLKALNLPQTTVIAVPYVPQQLKGESEAEPGINGDAMSAQRSKPAVENNNFLCDKAHSHPSQSSD